MSATPAIDPPSREKSLELAVGLVRQQNDIVNHWMTAFLQMEAALVAALAVIVNWATAERHVVVQTGIVFCAVAGIVIADLSTKAINRHLEWQRYYVGRVKLLQCDFLPLFDDTGPKPEGAIRYIFDSLTTWLTLGWLLGGFLCFLLIPRP